MVIGVRSIRVFSQVLLDPYYEPLPWFMIYTHNSLAPLQYLIPTLAANSKQYIMQPT